MTFHMLHVMSQVYGMESPINTAPSTNSVELAQSPMVTWGSLTLAQTLSTTMPMEWLINNYTQTLSHPPSHSSICCLQY